MMEDIKIRELEKKCCKLFGISVRDLYSQCRKRIIVDARTALWKIMYCEFGLTQTAIGKIYGKNHATVNIAIRTAFDLYVYDKIFKSRYQSLFAYAKELKYLENIKDFDDEIYISSLQD